MGEKSAGLPPSGFGAALKRVRGEKGLTQKQLGAAAGIHPNTVAKLERGEVEPSWQVVLAVVGALGVDCTAFSRCDDVADEPAAPEKPGKDGGAVLTPALAPRRDIYAGEIIGNMDRGDRGSAEYRGRLKAVADWINSPDQMPAAADRWAKAAIERLTSLTPARRMRSAAAVLDWINASLREAAPPPAKPRGKK